MTDVEYFEPESVAEACGLLDQYGEDARLMAGGTALVLFMRQRLLAPSVLINLQQIRDLATIRSGDDGVTIGATVTHTQAQRSDALRLQHSALAETFAKVATPRIRNVGTVGGNLAHGDPHLDPPVTLLALDAAVTAESTRGTRQIPLTAFFRDYYETALQPDEVLTQIRVPAAVPGAGLAFIKFLPRSQDDYATVDVAAWVRTGADGVVQDVRLALGSVGPVPFRATDAETLIHGNRLTDDLLAEAGSLAAATSDPEDDVRGSPAYKRELIKVLVRRVINQAIERARRPQLSS